MTAETYGGILVYSIRKVYDLRLCYKNVLERETRGYCWVFGTLLYSMDLTKHSL